VTPEAVLQEAKAFLIDQVAPRAEIIDRDPDALREALQGLCDRDFMALKRPAEFGGPELPEPLFREFQEECARTSGALSFLQTQHQSAVSLIAKGENEGLKAEYLPKMGSGEKLVGIGFSQLRRAGAPIMTATPAEDGYTLEGKVPWVTGWSFYPEFLVGASLPDGRALFGIVPLPASIPVEGVRVSPPMRLAAMETALTVSVEFENYFLPQERVAFIKPAGWIQKSDMINIALQGHFALGCARAGIDIVEKNAAAKPLPFLRETADKLLAEWRACHEETSEAQRSVEEETTVRRLNVRAWAIDLAVRCAHAAITSSSGAANSLDHPAQRVFREALVYTVSAQTSPIMEATLNRLVR
jgi:alkylation response protein AidB-like acyl-CoA dehydrogenase